MDSEWKNFDGSTGSYYLLGLHLKTNNAIKECRWVYGCASLQILPEQNASPFGWYVNGKRNKTDSTFW
jgi:hypothetical protein